MRADGPVLLCIFIGVPWILGWIARTNWTHQRDMKALELRAEANARLLDRLGSDPSFLDFLKSDAERHLFDVTLQDPNRSQPYMRMLTALQVSFLLLGAAHAAAVGARCPSDESGTRCRGVDPDDRRGAG